MPIARNALAAKIDELGPRADLGVFRDALSTLESLPDTPQDGRAVEHLPMVVTMPNLFQDPDCRH